MGEPGQRIRLVHELAQLAGPEELLDGGHHRADVDEALRGDRLGVLGGHALAHHPLQPGEAHADLILDQLAHGAHPAVAEVVDVVGAVPRLAPVQADEVADGLEDVRRGEQPQALLAVALHLAGLQRAPAELLVQLVAAHPGQVVALGVVEQGRHEPARRLHRGELARAQLAVQVQEGVVALGGDVAFQGGADDLGPVEEVEQLLVGLAEVEAPLVGPVGVVEGPQEGGHVLAALAVDPHPHRVLLVDVELEPGAPARDDLGGEDVAVGGLVDRLVEVDPGGTHQLAHHDPLGAVDDERPVGGHHREVAQEDLLLLDLPGGAVDEAGRHEEGARVVGVALLGLVDGQGGLIETVIGEFEGEGPGEVLDGRDFLEDLPQAPLQEPAERVVLNRQEVG